MVNNDNENTVVEPLDDDDLMLTTIDNPYNPKEDYPKWRRWDVDSGYHTESFIARMIDLDGEGVIDVDDDIAISLRANKAIHEILEHDVLGVYKLI